MAQNFTKNGIPSLFLSCEFREFFYNSFFTELIGATYSINRSQCFQKQPLEVFCNEGVLRNFAKFTGKHLCQRLWHGRFPVNFGKFLRTTFLQNTSGRLLLSFLPSSKVKAGALMQALDALLYVKYFLSEDNTPTFSILIIHCKSVRQVCPPRGKPFDNEIRIDRIPQIFDRLIF